MSTSLAIGFALLVLNTLFGILANGFIVLFICIDWFRKRKSSPTDLILCCLGLSRFLWHMMAILTSIGPFLKYHTYIQNYTSTMIAAMWFFVNSVNLWFAAWLSVLYFVKVTVFSHPVILQVKQRYSGLVPWLLLGSVVFSAALTIIIIIIITTGTNVFSTYHSYQSLSSNSSSSEIQTLNFCRYVVILYYGPNIIPSMLFLSSSILLISSLCQHIRHLQSSGTGIKDLNMQIHLTAIKVLVSFTVLYLSSFIAAILLSLNSEVHWTVAIFANVSAMYPSGHSIILILANPKLKEGCVRMLHHFKCRLSESPS